MESLIQDTWRPNYLALVTSWMMGMRSGDDDPEGSCSWLMMPKRHTARGSPKLFKNLWFLQACDPGLSRTCDQNIYLSGLCYLFRQNLRGPVLQGHPGYQGKERGIRWVKIPPSGCPYMGTGMGRPTLRDPLPSPSVSGLCRMYKGQRRLGISVWWLKELAARWISENSGLHEGCDEETQQLFLPGKYIS